MPLFEAERHERITQTAWDADRASETIDAIVRNTRGAFDRHGSWPSHPSDVGARAPAPSPGLYFGATGILWAMAQFGERVPSELTVLRALAEASKAQVAPFGEHYDRGLLLSRTGALAVASLTMGDASTVEHLFTLVSGNVENPVCDFAWGSAGTMRVAMSMFGKTGDARWKNTFVDSAKQLERDLAVSASTDARLWVQERYGSKGMHLGAGDGFAGNAGVILLGGELLSENERTRWGALVRASVKRTAIREGGLANWPQVTGDGRADRGPLLVQWCRGAPGMIVGLGALIDGADPEFDALMVAGGELTWRAGPLEKGPGLCHGTAGNGYAFLRLYHQTRQEQWLERARAFAMHAIHQSRAAEQAHGGLRHALFSGDIGTALYLRACITLDPRFPAFEYL